MNITQLPYMGKHKDLDKQPIEFSYDPHSAMGLVIEDQLPVDTHDPLTSLVELEEFLIDQYGMTFLQAVRAGVLTRN